MTIHTKDQLTFTVSLSQPAHQLAEKFCQHQSNLQKAEQVYLNTLAVYAVNYHLQCLGFATDLEESDSWDPVMQAFLDVADLQVKNYGKLECRPVLPDAAMVYIPEEVWEERIGYVAVQLDESLREATLLGFAEAVSTQELSLSQLRSLEDLPGYLNQLKQPQLAAKWVDLSQWLHNIFDASWETMEVIFAPSPELALNFRQPFPALASTPENPAVGVKRGKRLDLGRQQSGEQVALCVGLAPTESSKMDICVDVYPVSSQPYLPQDLQVMVLDEKGEALVQAQARSTENIQLTFRGQPGEGFGIKVVLGDVTITEAFMI
jgi:hypothetical protein